MDIKYINLQKFRRKIFRRKNFGGKNFGEIFKNRDFLQNKAIFTIFLENFLRFQPIFENFLDFGGFNFGERFRRNFFLPKFLEINVLFRVSTFFFYRVHWAAQLTKGPPRGSLPSRHPGKKIPPSRHPGKPPGGPLLSKNILEDKPLKPHNVLRAHTALGLHHRRKQKYIRWEKFTNVIYLSNKNYLFFFFDIKGNNVVCCLFISARQF